MSDPNETIADIVREIRAAAYIQNADTPEPVFAFANRIEAAVERERNAHANDVHDALYMATGIPGNAAALREALVKIEKLNHYDLGCVRSEKSRRAMDAKILDIELTIRAALSAPARNCDRFATAEEARRAFEEAHSREIVHNLYTAAFDWLFAEAKGGDHA